MKDQRDRTTLLILKKSKTKAEKEELRHYLSMGIYCNRPRKWTFNPSTEHNFIAVWKKRKPLLN